MITPVTEEVFKGLFLFWLLSRRGREITGVLDTIVYAGLVGAGFSFVENSLYFGRPLMEAAQSRTALAALGVTFFMRVLMVPFFHSLMVAMTAVGVGIAANRCGRTGRIVPPLLGLLVATILHGIWDWAGLASNDQYLIFKVYGTAMVPVFVAMLVVALVLRRRQGRMTAEGASLLVRAGDIGSEEATALSTLSGRRLWRAEVRQSVGRSSARAASRYQSEASALAVRLRRGTPGDVAWIPEQRRIVAQAHVEASRGPLPH